MEHPSHADGCSNWFAFLPSKYSACAVAIGKVAWRSRTIMRFKMFSCGPGGTDRTEVQRNSVTSGRIACDIRNLYYRRPGKWRLKSSLEYSLSLAFSLLSNLLLTPSQAIHGRPDSHARLAISRHPSSRHLEENSSLTATCSPPKRRLPTVKTQTKTNRKRITIPHYIYWRRFLSRLYSILPLPPQVHLSQQ